MTRFILKRIGQAIIILFLLTVIVFALSRMSGDPTSLYLPDTATSEQIMALREEWGFDKPLTEQYRLFLFNILRGDFGRSLRYNIPALELFLVRVPPTAALCGLSLLVALVLGFMAGILAAVKKGSVIDSFVMIVTLIGQAAPPFVASLVLIYLFAGKLRWFPTSGYGGIRYLILPTIALSMFFVAAIARLLRGSMLETLEKDYVRLARIKGLKERVVILKHALKNSIIPVITYAGPLSVMLVTAALAIEAVFAWPGIGYLAYQATASYDFPLVQVTVLILAAALIFVNIVVDILYAWIDPRIRLWK
jgi:peptide/nickel transport system permease protein